MNQAERSWLADTRVRLAQRRGEKPVTKAGQVRALWPEIEAALQGGQSMKSICKWLEEDAGIKLGLTSLTSYISRIRRRERRRSPAHAKRTLVALRALSRLQCRRATRWRPPCRCCPSADWTSANCTVTAIQKIKT